jgi:hypothetical protein
MRCTPMRCTHMRYTPVRYTPVRYTPVRYTPVRCTSMKSCPWGIAEEPEMKSVIKDELLKKLEDISRRSVTAARMIPEYTPDSSHRCRYWVPNIDQLDCDRDVSKSGGRNWKVEVSYQNGPP